MSAYEWKSKSIWRHNADLRVERVKQELIPNREPLEEIQDSDMLLEESFMPVITSITGTYQNDQESEENVNFKTSIKEEADDSINIKEELEQNDFVEYNSNESTTEEIDDLGEGSNDKEKEENDIEILPHSIKKEVINVFPNGIYTHNNLVVKEEGILYDPDRQIIQQEQSEHDAFCEDSDVEPENSINPFACLNGLKSEFIKKENGFVLPTVRPEVVKIHKVVLQSGNDLIEIDSIKNSGEMIISEIVVSSDEESFNVLNDDVGDLLAPLGFQCSICLKRYQSLKRLNRHELTHNGLQTTLKQNKVMKKPAPKTAIRLAKDGSYTCNCGKVFRRRSSVTACLKSHETAGLACEWCSLVFHRQADIKRHKRLEHANIIKAKSRCPVCNKLFGYRKSFERHLKLHALENSTENSTKVEQNNATGESNTRKIVSCDECGVKFRGDDQLKQHIDVQHTNPRLNEQCSTSKKVKNSAIKFKFTCRTCGQGFSTLKAFTEHKATHKNKVKFECVRCRDRFRSKSELSAHRRLHCRGGQYPPRQSDYVAPPASTSFSCDICLRHFSTKVLMLKHKAKHPFVIFAKDDSTHKQIFFK